MFIAFTWFAYMFQGSMLMAIEAATSEDYESDEPVQHAKQAFGHDFVSHQVILSLAEEYPWVLPRW